MNNIRAFIVGVSRYDVSGWNTDGPARNALAVIRWLVENGASPEQIHAFVDLEGLPSSDQEWLRASCIPIQGTSQNEINTFWRTKLHTLPGDRLLTFWSGHGMTDSNDKRLFFCRDYTTALSTSVFNATEFLAHMRGSDFNRFSKQLLFADVCGSYFDSPTSPTNSVPAAMRPTEQLTIFASPDGRYSYEKNGFGVFTDALLQALRHFTNRWPEQEEFLGCLEPIVKNWTQKPFRIGWRGTNDEVHEFAAGRPAGERNEYATSALSLLVNFPLAGPALRRPYVLTANNLGIDAILQAQSLPAMIDELSDLQDGTADSAPFGLVQFLTRLKLDAGLAAKHAKRIGAWLKENSDEHTRATVYQIMQAEGEKFNLVVRVDNDRNGFLTGFQPSLLNATFKPDTRASFTYRKVANWSDFAGAIEELINRDLGSDVTRNFEVHFLVDPPLLDLPFHQISLDPNTVLGERHVCIIHYRERALGKDVKQIERWREWLRKLQGENIRGVPLVEVVLDSSPISDDKGIFYASFPLGQAHGPTPEKLRLVRVLRAGAPYVCWSNVSRDGIAAALRELLDGAEVFAKFPDRLLEERNRDSQGAGPFAFLWDDSMIEPLTLTRGIAE